MKEGKTKEKAKSSHQTWVESAMWKDPTVPLGEMLTLPSPLKGGGKDMQKGKEGGLGELELERFVLGSKPPLLIEIKQKNAVD